MQSKRTFFVRALVGVVLGVLIGLLYSLPRPPAVSSSGLPPGTNLPPSPKTGPVYPIPQGLDDPQIHSAYVQRHLENLNRARQGGVDLLFLGDSITDNWSIAPTVWNQHYGVYRTVNFGISGDQTQNVLWRIGHQTLEGISPRVVVLEIGTNNLRMTDDEVVAGVRAVVAAIHEKLPQSKILLLGIFPRGDDPSHPLVAALRAKIARINAELAKLDDGDATRFLNIGRRFQDPRGWIPPDIMPDALHLSVKGYRIWADAMDELLQRMMRPAAVESEKRPTTAVR